MIFEKGGKSIVLGGDFFVAWHENPAGLLRGYSLVQSDKSLTRARGQKYHHLVMEGISSEACGLGSCVPRKKQILYPDCKREYPILPWAIDGFAVGDRILNVGGYT